MSGRVNRLSEVMLIGVPLLLSLGHLRAAAEEAFNVGEVIGFGYFWLVSACTLYLALRRRRTTYSSVDQ